MGETLTKMMGPLQMAAGATATAMGAPQAGIPLMMGGFQSTASGSQSPGMQQAGGIAGGMGQMAPAAMSALGMGGQPPAQPPPAPPMQAKPPMPPPQSMPQGMPPPNPAPPSPGGMSPQTGSSAMMDPRLRQMLGLM